MADRSTVVNRPERRRVSPGTRRGEEILVRAWVFLVIGVLLLLIGVVWTLQGIGTLGGSVMTGVALWAVIGPVVGLVGLVLGWMGVRRMRA